MIQSLLVGFMSIVCPLLYSSWGPGQTFIQFLRAKNVSMEAMGLEKLIAIDQSLTLYAV